jgi:methyl-accepting chemotaxis protein
LPFLKRLKPERQGTEIVLKQSIRMNLGINCSLMVLSICALTGISLFALVRIQTTLEQTIGMVKADAVGAKAVSLLREQYSKCAEAAYLLAAFALIAVVVAIFSAVMLHRRLFRRIIGMQAILKEEIGSHMTGRLQVKDFDEVATTSLLLDSFMEKVRAINARMTAASAQFSTESAHLASLTEQAAAGNELVVSSISNVAAASTQMSATSEDIARNCLLAADSAGKVEAMASQSAYIVMESVNIMNAISDYVRDSSEIIGGLGRRSEQIGDIVSTIEDIADQTNLLALNAAIEAARAGEQGRGFAVVADEVRALAERTTRATREISDMIKMIQDEIRKAIASMETGGAEVENGVQESAKSSEALVEVLSQITEISAQLGQIATAAEQQTATTNEINMSIQQVNEVVMEGVSTGSSAAEAAVRLSARACELQGLVAEFKSA